MMQSRKNGFPNIIDGLYKSLAKSESNISLEVIKNDQPNVYHEIEKIFADMSDSLGSQYSVFIGGSFALCLRSRDYSDFKLDVDKSDIDLFIITGLAPTPKCNDELIQTAREKLTSYDMSCVAGHNDTVNFSIKVATLPVIVELLTNKRKSFKVFRYKSLLNVKSTNNFSSFVDTKEFVIVEETAPGGYCWRWDGLIEDAGRYYLDDLRSLFLFGGVLYDGLELSKYTKKFTNSNKESMIKQQVDKPSIKNLLSYFYSENPVSSEILFGSM
jgi:hypothetical protein